MLFVELRFLLFFGVVFGVHWTLKSAKLRRAWLLVCSYVFYAGWDWRFLSLILTSTLVDYTVGLALSKTEQPRKRTSLLMLSLVANLGLLGFFKYYNFFVSTGAEFLTSIGLPTSPHVLQIILPVGISFYTFQTLSYTIDVYRRKLDARKSLLDVALFVAFFPQLVAGPIVRAAEFLPQLEKPRQFDWDRSKGYLTLFLLGFIKKACVSDNLAPVVDRYFENPEQYDALSGWVGVSAYAAQIYCDFSGYSDMAIACAGLLGYRFLVNFNFPYFSANITKFWRRWHISLSSWLRDYLYIPLGGNRHGRFKTYRNLMLTMLLGGLWHGAAWTFVIWGGLHGFALMVHRGYLRLMKPWPKIRASLGVLGPFLTFYWVCVAWIFFRARSVEEALSIVRAFVFLDGGGEDVLCPDAWIVAVSLAAVHYLCSRVRLEERANALPTWAFAILYGVASATALSAVPGDYKPFIYFQF